MNRVLTLFHKINKGHNMKKTIILSVLSTLALIGCKSEDTKVKNVTNALADDITQTKRELAQ
ncbi:DUF3103 domain-containing protein, partial [Vibrio parahaemolyticus]|nr:DUF3103 domain-containing protein [Vibrio parahaemolyticus]